MAIHIHPRQRSLGTFRKDRKIQPNVVEPSLADMVSGEELVARMRCLYNRAKDQIQPLMSKHLFTSRLHYKLETGFPKQSILEQLTLLFRSFPDSDKQLHLTVSALPIVALQKPIRIRRQR
jgi:hypothetical protein